VAIADKSFISISSRLQGFQRNQESCSVPTGMAGNAKAYPGEKKNKNKKYEES
jgi:hypothetical protein